MIVHCSVVHVRVAEVVAIANDKPSACGLEPLQVPSPCNTVASCGPLHLPRYTTRALLTCRSNVHGVCTCRLNSQSSRSHAILTITLQQRAHAATARTLPQELRCLASKLHLVDLAGSERTKETGTTGTSTIAVA